MTLEKLISQNNIYDIVATNGFMKQLNRIIFKQHRSEADLVELVFLLANNMDIPNKYKNHLLEPKSQRLMGMSHKAGLVVNI